MITPEHFKTIRRPKHGYEWIYRGQGWKPEGLYNYAVYDGHGCWDYYNNNTPMGYKYKHYYELVEVMAIHTLEEKIQYAKSLVGKTVWWGDTLFIVNSWNINVDKFGFSDFSLVGKEVDKSGVCVYVNIAGLFAVPINHPDLKVYDKPKFEEVKLNGDYTAKVYKDKVEVGCQTFPVSIINDLAAAHIRIKG